MSLELVTISPDRLRTLEEAERLVANPNIEAAAKRIWHMSPCEQSWDYVMQTAVLAIEAAFTAGDE